MVPIIMDDAQLSAWEAKAETGELNLTVDLETKKITDDAGQEVDFDLPEYHRHNLINGLDEIALTLQLEEKISNYEKTHL